jgi:ferredoxin
VSAPVPSPVHHFDLSGVDTPDLDQGMMARAVQGLVEKLSLQPAAGQQWGLKVQLGAPGYPAAVPPAWAEAAGRGIGSRGPVPGLFTFDTLSITQEGLHTESALLTTARAQGYLPDQGAVPFRAGDADGDGLPDREKMASGVAGAEGLLLLSTVRAHPHLGFSGAVAAQGLGLSHRAGKLVLHEGIRPQVDTPLCAGCGSCLAVCLFDAIRITGGRAFIDHTRCTGCGECMTVCHMAGIRPEEAARIPVFQEKVADTAADFARQAPWGKAGQVAYVNFLVHLNRGASRSGSRRAVKQRHLGILAGHDPVAVDRATWDLLAGHAGGSLSAWGGYLQEPGPLLDRAAARGLGSAAYTLVEMA